MSRSMFRLAALSVLVGMVLIGTAAAQDFQKSYQVGASASVSIGSISGDVVVKGYDGSAIIVTAYKTGRDRDRVEVEDNSTANRVEVKVRYPRNCNCDASVRFEVQVPRSINYEFDSISSVSGDVEVSGVRGQLNASSVSGEVRVKEVTGSVSASAVSGNVDVEINRLEGSDNMKFSSVSGDVTVRVPSSLDADVNMSSFSGTIKTDFPLEMRESRYGSKNSARGKVGNGTRSLRISTISGEVSLIYSTRG